ncbi:MAG: hemolysin family protein [Thermodesulfobacteriota bacterium]
MSIETLILEAAIIFILILLNGLFSGSEIAIISARRGVIDKLEKEGNRSAKTVNKLKEKPDNFLATVQIGVTVVGTLASVVGGVIAIELLKPAIQAIPIPPVQALAEPISIGIVVAIISYALLIIGELVPKSIALRSPERTACLTARPINLLSRLSSAPVRILTASTHFVLRLFGIKDTTERVFISEEEIKYFMKEGRMKGIFEETEEALIHGVFEFADTTVREVMVPKPKMSAIEISTPPEEALKFIVETGFSRYPVYRENIENISGTIYNKDVFRVLEEKSPLVIQELMRSPYFVPDSILISRLLREMQRRRVHMAIVIDEHGNVDGLVTIEDLLEEIVGEIEDEFDIEKEGLIERLRDGTLLIDASAPIRDIKDTELPFDEEDEEEFNTVAGFMLAKLQRIPRGGEFTVHKGYRFTIVDVEERRIVKVKAERLRQDTALMGRRK